MQLFMEVDGNAYVFHELDRKDLVKHLNNGGKCSCELCGLYGTCMMDAGKVHKDSECIYETCAKASIDENIACPHIWIKCGKVQKPVPEKTCEAREEANFGKTGPVRRSARNKSASRVRKSNRRSKVR